MVDSPYHSSGRGSSGKTPLTGVTGVVYQRHNATDTDVKADQEKASLMPRRSFNNSPTAKNIVVAINSHRVSKFPTRNIYQYDVSYPARPNNLKLLSLT